MFVITGGGTGIGRALAHALADRDHAVMIVGRRLDKLQQTANYSPRIDYHQGDMSAPEDREILAKLLTQKDHIQGLIHNAGTVEPIETLNKMTLNEWQQCMATNVEAPLFLTQALLPILGQARILNIGTGAAHFPVQAWSAYCSSKAALFMLTRCWQLELDLTITSVMPGIVDTPMAALIRQSEHMAPQKLEFFRQLKASQRLISPETAASFLIWLLLDVSREAYIAQEWDIYDVQHHSAWLKFPHVVPSIEN